VVVGLVGRKGLGSSLGTLYLQIVGLLRGETRIRGTHCPKNLAVCTYREFATGTEFRDSLAWLRDGLSGHAGFVPIRANSGRWWMVVHLRRPRSSYE
jgi:hypothetical protein